MRILKENLFFNGIFQYTIAGEFGVFLSNFERRDAFGNPWRLNC